MQFCGMWNARSTNGWKSCIHTSQDKPHVPRQRQCTPNLEILKQAKQLKMQSPMQLAGKNTGYCWADHRARRIHWLGRSRNRGNAEYVPSKDGRQFLYREYLRVIAMHQPSVFVMENVKGLLSGDDQEPADIQTDYRRFTKPVRQCRNFTAKREWQRNRLSAFQLGQ